MTMMARIGCSPLRMDLRGYMTVHYEVDSPTSLALDTHSYVSFEQQNLYLQNYHPTTSTPEIPNGKNQNQITCEL